jgi:hypothetical protein
MGSPRLSRQILLTDPIAKKFRRRAAGFGFVPNAAFPSSGGAGTLALSADQSLDRSGSPAVIPLASLYPLAAKPRLRGRACIAARWRGPGRELGSTVWAVRDIDFRQWLVLGDERLFLGDPKLGYYKSGWRYLFTIYLCRRLTG